jgi:hypothetical protein
MKHTKVITFLFILVFLSGCKTSQTEVFTLSKKTTYVLETHESETISWSISDKWSKSDSRGFRIGSYEFLTLDGQLVTLTISKIDGNAGGLEANVNRWRGQLQLPKLATNELLSTIITPTMTIPISLVDLISEAPLNGQYYQRTLAAISSYENSTYFFKLTGAYHSVDNFKVEFIDLLNSVVFK